jgi:hypothetical protein
VDWIYYCIGFRFIMEGRGELKMNDDFNSRDLFAALAMCGLVVNRGFNSEPEQHAVTAYKIADAMIKARAPEK